MAGTVGHKQNSNDPERRLSDDERDFLLYRILDEKIDYKDSYIRDPNGKEFIDSKLFYHKTLNYLNKVNPSNDKNAFYINMVERGIWSVDEEKELNNLPEKIDNKKQQYFLSYFNVNTRKVILSEILGLYKEYTSLNERRSILFHMSNHGHASEQMFEYLMRKIYNGKDIVSAINFYNSNEITESAIRQIVRSSEWSQYWYGDINMFGKPIMMLTQNKRRLITWSKIYESVKGSMDCPIDKIFEDNYAFDGWMINQSRKDRAEKANKTKISGVKDGRTNVYLPFSGQQEAKEIYSMNDGQSMNRIRTRFKQVDKEGAVKEERLVDRKLIK